MADDAERAAAAAAKLLGTTVNGHLVRSVYVEERVAIADEYYLSFVLSGARSEVLVSRSGGVDIEEVSRTTPEKLVRLRIDPLNGLDTWIATDLWYDAGLRGTSLPRIAALTTKLYDAFCRADALLLEVNPLAIDAAGHSARRRRDDGNRSRRPV
ncbi:MAG: hypothetical protein GEV05_13125 [Betaproteobacteria bacterium]|nr:hypothetical protein [Betaproteobacteria bacterium]